VIEGFVLVLLFISSSNDRICEIEDFL
jgi:hypothetical protein